MPLFFLLSFTSAHANEGWLPLVEDNSGTFTMQVPIEVPDGVAGLSPDLSIVYSSAGGNGNAGMGWELAYPSIRLDQRWGVPWYWHQGQDLCDLEAMNGRIFLDDAELVPSFDDPLLNVDDMGAVQRSRKDGPCTFRTRPDSFVLVRPVFTSGHDEPHGFVVFQPDGSTWWYGDEDPDQETYRIRSDARDLGDGSSVPAITTRWLLHSVMDRDGNTVRYWPERRPVWMGDAVEDSGGCDGCLRAVTWTAKKRGDPKTYTAPGDPFTSYQGGGITKKFRHAIEDPTQHWPPQQPSHYFFALVDWEERPDRRVSYASGGLRILDRRVRQVVVGGDYERIEHDGGAVEVDLGTEAHVFRSYRLDYDEGTTGRSRLRRVWEFPGVYDGTGTYSSFGVPVSGELDWNPMAYTGPELPNPYEFVYSDSATLDSTAISDGFELPGDPQSMGMEGSNSATADVTPWLGASYQEGGFQTIEMADVNGDSLPDLVQHQQMLPGWHRLTAPVMDLLWPFADDVPNDPLQFEADLDAASSDLWVRFNEGDGFSEPEAFVQDPLAVLPVVDFLPDPSQSQDGSDAGFDGASDWLDDILESMPEDSPGGAVARYLKLELGDAEAEFGETAECVAEQLEMFGMDPTTPLAEVDEDILLSCVPADVAEEVASSGWGSLETGIDEDFSEFAVDLDDLDCTWWTAGGPSQMTFMGMPYVPVMPGGPQSALASWCEFRSCAPYCEVGTSITIGPAHTIGWGMNQSTAGLPENGFVEDIVKGTPLDAPSMTLWGRYATTRASSGNALSTLASFHPIDLPLLGIEPQTKVRWVDGYGRTSFQTRIRSSHLELARESDGNLGTALLQDIQFEDGLRPDNEWTVQEGLVHSTRDWNGDGCPDRQVGGAGILHSDVDGGYDFAYNTRWWAAKDLLSSNAHIPTHIAYCDPETGEFGAWETFVLPLEHPWLMGSSPEMEATFGCTNGVDCPLPGEPVDFGNDPRLFDVPYNFNFLKVQESNSEAAHAGVSAGVGGDVGFRGPSTGASLSIGPLSLRASVSATGGGSLGVGVAGGSIGTSGFSVGGFSVDFQGNASNSAWSWIIFVVTRLLETFDVPYHAGISPSTNGISLSLPGFGGDTLVDDPRVRWTVADHFDINGDGLVDYVFADNPDWHKGPIDQPRLEDELDWVACINDGQGSCEVTHWPGVHTRYLEATVSDIYRETDGGVNAQLGYRLGRGVLTRSDHNGDGLVDVLYAGYREGFGGCLPPPEFAYTENEGSAWVLMDSDEEILEHRDRQTLCVQLNTGAGFAAPFDAFRGSPPDFTDMDSHVVAPSCTRSRIEQSNNYRDDWGRGLCGLEDFNGDGLVDYWTFEPRRADVSEDGELRVFLNDGLFFRNEDGIGPGQRYGAFNFSLGSMTGLQRIPGDPEYNNNVAGPQAQYFQSPQMLLNIGTAWERPGGTVIQNAIGDLNGDGALDWAQSVASWGDTVDNQVLLFPLQTEVPDLLTQVWEPGGATRTLDYSPSREFMDLPTVDRMVHAADGTDLTGPGYDVHPAPAQVLVAETLYDGLGPKGAPPQRVTYAYGTPTYRHGGDPDWPSYWRRSYGWGWIYAETAPVGEVDDFDGVGVLTRFGPIVSGWSAAGGETTLPTAGLIASRRTMDLQGRIWEQATLDWDGTRFGDLYPHFDGQQANWHFAMRKQTTEVYEPQSSETAALVTTTWTRKNRMNGAVDCTVNDDRNLGGVDRAEGVLFDAGLAQDGVWDAVKMSRTYVLEAFDEADPDSWCGRGVEWADVRRRTSFGHYPSGRLAWQEQQDPVAGMPPVTTEYAYGDRGEPVAERSPTGGVTLTSWDHETATLPLMVEGPPNTDVSPAVQYFASTEYCGRDHTCPTAAWGKPRVAIDPNGAGSWWTYDSLGRVAAQGDDVSDVGSGGTFFGYSFPQRRVTVESVPTTVGGLPAMVGSTAGISGAGEPRESIESAAFLDGLGREVLAVKSSVVDGVDGWSMSGWSERDERGRVVAETWPCFVGPSMAADLWDLVDPGAPDLGLCTEDVRLHTFEYDLADRVVAEMLPDGGMWERDVSILPTGNMVHTWEVFDGPDMTAPIEQEVYAGPRLKMTFRHGAQVASLPPPDGHWPEPGPTIQEEIAATTEEYDALGQRLEVMRSPFHGPATEWAYDGMGRVMRYSDPDQGTWTFSYGDDGLIDQRIEWTRDGYDPVRQTFWEHDVRGRVLFEDHERWQGGSPYWTDGWRWTYDVGDLLDGPSGPADVYGVAPIGQATRAEHWQTWDCGGAGSDRMDLAYDWRHDPRGRVVEATETMLRCDQGAASMPEKLRWQAQYREDGQERWTRRPMDETEVVTWFDPAGQATSKGVAISMGPTTFASTADVYLADAVYDLFGRPLSFDLGNGVRQTFDYESGLNTSGSLTETTVKSPADGLIFHRAYDWDEAGNLRGWLGSMFDAPLQGFTCGYDGVGRLLGCGDTTGKEEYAYGYDAAGNLVWESARRDGGYTREAWQYTGNRSGYVGDAPLNATVARLSEGSEGWKAMSLRYDGRGQVLEWEHHDPRAAFVGGGAEVTEEGLVGLASPLYADAERRFSWGANGRLEGVSVSTGGPFEDVSGFGYGPGGQRAYEWVQVPGEMTPRVTRRFGGVDLSEDPDGSMTLTSHVSVNGRQVSQVTDSVGAVPLTGVVQETRYFAGDHLGSASVVTDELGRVRTAVRYEPYGRVRFEGGSTGLEEDYEYGAVDRLFNGKLRQRAVFGAVGGAEEIEGYDYGARVYFPELGRWGSADSVTPDLVWEANPFEYVRGNPLRYVDPDGHESGPSLAGPLLQGLLDTKRALEGWDRALAMNGDEVGPALRDFFNGQHNPFYEYAVLAHGDDPYRGQKLEIGGLEHRVRVANLTITLFLGIHSGLNGGLRLGGPMPLTWNEFQAATRGMFRGKNGRAEAAKWWARYKKLIRVDTESAPPVSGRETMHGNTAGNQPATLYARYDSDGNFLKWGVSQDPDQRYTSAELDGGYIRRIAEGARRDMLDLERVLVETRPGPLNGEPWAGSKIGD